MPTSSSGIRPRRARSRSRPSNDALDWSPYDGLDIPGTLRHVLARGDRAVEDGRWLDADHRGEYLPVRRVAAPM
jgi:hypothetical protein